MFSHTIILSLFLSITFILLAWVCYFVRSESYVCVYSFYCLNKPVESRNFFYNCFFVICLFFQVGFTPLKYQTSTHWFNSRFSLSFKVVSPIWLQIRLEWKSAQYLLQCMLLWSFATHGIRAKDERSRLQNHCCSFYFNPLVLGNHYYNCNYMNICLFAKWSIILPWTCHVAGTSRSA